jgi:hypothetical protein
VLTHRRQSPRHAVIDNATTHARDDANDVQKTSTRDCWNYKKPCAAIVSAIRASLHRTIADVFTTLECRFKVLCADSESRILAMKKFSCPPASGLIAARQNQFFARIAKSDSEPDFPFATLHRPS